MMVMAEARKRAHWEPFSMFMCMFANSKRDPKKKSFKVDDFFPFDMEKRATKAKKNIPKGKITDLVHLFKGGVRNAPKV